MIDEEEFDEMGVRLSKVESGLASLRRYFIVAIIVLFLAITVLLKLFEALVISSG